MISYLAIISIEIDIPSLSILDIAQLHTIGVANLVRYKHSIQLR